MNRILLVALAVLTMSAAGVTAALAQTDAGVNVHAPTVKIGWMNVEQAILTSDEGAGMMADIQRFVETKQTERDAMMRELDDLRGRLEVQASRLTDEALMELEQKMVAQEVTLQRFVEDTQRDIDVRRQRMYATISQKMGPVIEKVALDKGLDAILIFDPQRDAWVNPGLNMTEEIVKAYNQAYPAGAPTMPAAAKKP